MNAQAVATSGKPTVISTFAGCGGSSLGYKLAGFRELLAVEWEKDAADTFALNFPEVQLYHGDIAKLSVAEVLEKTKLNPGELDVFDGSPPCQGFSTAGKRELGDSRNQLFLEFARLLTGLQPKVFVMENVTGMIKGHMRRVYLEIVKTLRGCGYLVKGEVLNAAHFGVAQSRERVIIIGVRNDLCIEPSHPKPSTKPITFLEATRAINKADPDEHRQASPRVLAYAKFHPGGWNTDIPLMVKISGKSHSCASLKWAQWERPTGTVAKQEICDSGIMHPNRQRYLSMRELMAVGSFPQDFIFNGRKNAVARIGNSVPPKLMEAVAFHIKENLL